MRLTINRYLWARLFCWLMSRLGYAVMLYPDHFGHQAIDVEYDLRTKKQRLLYLAGIVPNKALRRMHDRVATIIGIPAWLRVHLMEADVAFRCLTEPLSRFLEVYSNKEIWDSRPALEFSEEERAYGESVLKELGLEKGKYVCFHARDSRYASMHHPEVMERRISKRMTMAHQDMTEAHPFQKHRNVDFGGYYKSIDWLATQGLRAVRIGSDVERSYMRANLVDYAFSRGNSINVELADLYLMAHCKLYVGHGSGVTHMSCIWNTPGVCVNWFPYHPASRPTANITACRVKRLKVLGDTLNEFRSRHFFELANWTQIYEASREIEVIDNTPDEILDTVRKALTENSRHPKAWCNFNGTGTPAVTVGGSEPSVTANGTGDYTVSWTTAFSTPKWAK